LRNEVREENLKAIYANLPNLVSVTVDETQTGLIVALTKDLIKPNAFYNDERTREARRQAAAAIPPETRSFAQGQIVVRAGAIITEADLEALTQLKLLQPPDRRAQTMAGALLSVMLVSGLGAIYLRRFHTDLFHNVPAMVLIGGLFVFFLAGARAFGTVNDFQSHLYPATAAALMMVALAGPQASIAVNAGLAALTGLVVGNSLEFAALVAIGGAAGVLSLRRVERLNAYFTAGLVIGVVNVAIGLLFILAQGSVDPFRVLTVLVAGMLNGIIAAGLAVVGLYLISGLLNMPTSVRLIELSQPAQPLLQRLLHEAPGTYQHSLQVANLAELAAERIGAMAAHARWGALPRHRQKHVPAFFCRKPGGRRQPPRRTQRTPAQRRHHYRACHRGRKTGPQVPAADRADRFCFTTSRDAAGVVLLHQSA
jgi:membrane-associated HD superfamily phosphohydrolase